MTSIRFQGAEDAIKVLAELVVPCAQREREQKKAVENKTLEASRVREKARKLARAQEEIGRGGTRGGGGALHGAEVERLKAEAEKLRAEADMIRFEIGQGRARLAMEIVEKYGGGAGGDDKLAAVAKLCPVLDRLLKVRIVAVRE